MTLASVLLVILGCVAVAYYVLSHSNFDLGLFGSPYMLTGDIARTSTEALVGVSLIDGRDFYHYYSVTPGESHDLMRFTAPPHVLGEILANPTTLCFGTQLQPQPDENSITFITPVMPYKPVTPYATTAQPTADYTWLTPSSGHIYMGATCNVKTGKKTTFYRIRVDESNSQMWIVWLEAYTG